ncbi:peptide-methionine (S)-S-oxide reductase [Bradyrhizobium sp. S3.2.12]|uniref:peptide-methionine (S)-S-oxide reductase n=1 Tax=Bradyrhizobium sp. S3.2.12 TaxID=3156387 RepID=UPI003395B2BF
MVAGSAAFDRAFWKAGGGFDPDASALAAVLEARAPFGRDVEAPGATFAALARRRLDAGSATRAAMYRNDAMHAEAIEITFDPAKTSFRHLLELFFKLCRAPLCSNRTENGLEILHLSHCLGNVFSNTASGCPHYPCSRGRHLFRCSTSR